MEGEMQLEASMLSSAKDSVLTIYKKIHLQCALCPVALHHVKPGHSA